MQNIDDFYPNRKYTEELNRIESIFRSGQDNITILVRLTSELERLRAGILEDRSFFESQIPNLKQVAYDQAGNETINSADQILVNEIRKAALINREFDHPIFLSRLEQVAYDPRTINISYSNNDFIVVIDMELVGGSVDDWGKAVKSARGQMSKKPMRDNVMASHLWAEKYYGTAREGNTVLKKTKKGKVIDKTDRLKRKYWATMEARMNAMSSVAPFWYILNYGTVNLDSDHGGYAYPVNSATRFVEKAEQKIKDKYYSLVNKYLKNIILEIKRIQDLYVQLLNKITNLHFEIKNMIVQLSTRKDSGNINSIYNQVKTFLGEERFLRADQVKVMKLVTELSYGNAPARVRLGGGVRVRTSRLLGNI